jgi:hypothetical protein
MRSPQSGAREQQLQAAAVWGASNAVDNFEAVLENKPLQYLRHVPLLVARVRVWLGAI